MRILITGSRDWPDDLSVESAIWETMADHGEPDETVIVHGDCPTGADSYAKRLALEYPNMTNESHPADWSLGKSAGFKRNAKMVSLGADVCLAFIKDESKGASMTARLARTAGIPVTEYQL